MRFPVIHLHAQSANHHTATFTSMVITFHFLNTRTLSARADLHCVFLPYDAFSKMSKMAEPHCKIGYLTKVSKIPEKEALSLTEVGLRLQIFDRVLEVISIQTGIAFKYRF